jgi:hypothetical protein
MHLQNTRILTFFNEHPNLDPETTILKFIDIMETLHENMNSAMNNSMVIGILDKLKLMDTKIDHVSISVDKIPEDIKTQFTVKMSEFKKEYLNELNMTLTCNVSDKIAPLVREQNEVLFNKMNSMFQEMTPKTDDFITKSIEKIASQFQENVNNDTQQLLAKTIDKETFSRYLSDFNQTVSSTISSSQTILNNAIEKSEERLENKMDNIREISTNNNQTTTSLNTSVNDLLKKFDNSSSKGKMSENLIQNIIENLYPTAQIESVGQTKETGDIMITRPNKPTVLVENKLWNRSVVQAEVIKFIRDIEIQNCCGVFLSQNGTITTKDNFEINIHNGNVLVYVHDVNNDPDKIKTAINIVDHLKSTLDDISDDNVATSDCISKEILEYINSEYKNFAASKISLIKLAKDFNKKFLKEIEEIKLPALEDYLSTKFSLSSDKFICEYCDFHGKNQQSRSAHLRGCTQKKLFDAQKKTEKNLTLSIKTDT